jgi:deoxyribose-phosphate aldolase
VDAIHGREVLSPSGIARRFDSNLLDPTLSDDQFIHGCHRAIELGLAAVVCRPERVATAARATEGSDVAVCTGLNVRNNARIEASLSDISHAADRAVADGVRDLTLLVDAAQLQEGRTDALAEQISVIATSAASCGGMARVILMTSSMTPEQISVGCRLSVSCGADMVQGGALTTGDRASMSQLALMRRELGSGVLLKWMRQVPSLDQLLVARAEGVDRFWGDVEAVLHEARERESWGETIQVPLVGVDY